MKSRHRYALAFSLILLPLLTGAGVHLAEEGQSEVCASCGSTHRFREQRWNVWGFTNQRILGDEIEPSLPLRDFPEHHCDHDWHKVSSTPTRAWDGPVKLNNTLPSAPVKFVTFCCDSMPRSDELLALYDQSEWFRFLLNDALEDELVTRSQVVAWLKAEVSWDRHSDEMEGEDVAAFKRLDEILKRAQPVAPALPLAPAVFFPAVQFYE